MLWPLLVSGLVTRWTPVVDRFVASGLPTGSISHLGYAFRIVTLLSMLLATGISTVLYPRIAQAHAGGNDASFGRNVRGAISIMWLVVAPATAVGFALAVTAVSAVFQRGAFRGDDAIAVGELLRIYALSLPGTCLGMITGRAFYARQQTRVVAIGSTLEAIAYAIYTPMLARAYGVQGVAVSYVAYFSASVAWQLVLLWRTALQDGKRDLTTSVARSAVAAILAAGAAYAVQRQLPSPWAGLLAGLGAATIVFMVALIVMKSREFTMIRQMARDAGGRLAEQAPVSPSELT